MAAKKKLKPIDYGQAQLVLIPGGLFTKERIAGLEAKVDETSKQAHLNLLPSYGVLPKPMGIFGSTPTEADLTEAYLFLQQTFYGLHNMESLDGRYGVPNDMLIKNHPAVDLAIYYAAYVLKKMDVLPQDAFRGGNEKFQERMKKLAELQKLRKQDNVGEFVDKAFGYALQYIHGLRKFYHNNYSFLHSAQFKDRINSVPDAARIQFLKSLRLPRRSIDMTTPHFPYEGRDPHPENIFDQEGIRVYSMQIANFFKNLHARNTRPAFSQI